MRYLLIICTLALMLSGCGNKPKIQGFLVLKTPSVSSVEQASGKVKPYLDGKPLFSSQDILSAEQNPTQPRAVTITLSSDAVRRLHQVFELHLHDRMALVVDGKIVRIIPMPSLVTTSTLRITGLSDKQARQIDEVY
ncbi:preprotein translocase subunit SecD family protein [Dongshaea marina]|uniref:hypothetical protein n=1 Tax=Dongshaea marina TaxID=2047966 RepID=UPI000D3E45AD|nr:hypothetical protein [Dongshaea marina]